MFRPTPGNVNNPLQFNFFLLEQFFSNRVYEMDTLDTKSCVDQHSPTSFLERGNEKLEISKAHK